MKLLPLLQLVVLACWTEATEFEATGAVHCDKPGQTWCFWLTFYEEDFIKDDVFEAIGAKCSRRQSWPYQLKGVEHGDGLFDTHFEVALHVRHNCTKYGELREMWKFEKPYPVTMRKISVEWSPVLTNQGKVISFPGQEWSQSSKFDNE
uniref:Uncharacterized protein n=1 Tax=Caenorhabditis japonica TaxID=281687 RepID=A0A8R1IIK8_CAEJA